MGIQIETNGNAIRYVETPPVERLEKGTSIIDFPQNYTVIDIETTGLDSEYDSIIEVSAIRVRNGMIQNRFSSLVKPIKWYYSSNNCDDDDDYDEDEFIPLTEFEGYYYVDSFITNLTGITNEMLEDAPDPREVLSEFVKFVGDDILIGHNVNFDINFLYNAIFNELGITLKNNFVDTMRISRKVFPESGHHRLIDVAENCNIPYIDAHRAEQDCDITYSCYEKMREIVSEKFTSIDEFLMLFKSKSRGQKIDCSTIVANTNDFDEDHPFYQKMVVFTGALHGIVRKDAMQSVVNVGGYISDNVTKATNYLVVGSFDYIKSVKGNKSTKMKKAEKMRLDGLDIIVISESTFLEMLENK